MTASVASVCQVPRATGTGLWNANFPIGPQHTATGTVAIPLLPAGRCSLLLAITEQVETELLVDASTRAVAHLARVAFALGVSATGVLASRSQLPGNVACLAGTRATGVATVPVDTQPTAALTGSRTGLAVGLLGQTSRAVAIAVGTAMDIRRTTGLAGIEFAPVRATRLCRRVVACTRTIAVVDGVERTPRARLRTALCALVPVTTLGATVAGTIVPTSGRRCCRTLVLGVLAGGYVLTRSAAVTDLAMTALVWRVRIVGCICACAHGTCLVARAANTGTSAITANAVDTVARQALGRTRANLTIPQLRLALTGRTVVSSGAVGVDGAVGAASTATTHVRRTGIGSGIYTGSRAIALVGKVQGST